MTEYHVTRTLGQWHILLNKMKDGKPHRKHEFFPMLGMSAQSLQRLLCYGLATRSSYDTTNHKATFSITKLGLDALAELEKAQPLTSLTKELLEQHTWIDGKWVPLYGSGYSATHGFKRVQVIVKMDLRWVEHFSHVTW